MSPIFIYFFGLAVSAVWSAHTYRFEDAEKLFEEFIEEFGKEYEDENEKQYRFEIFVKNLQLINELNEESDHAVHGITKFVDLTVEEFRSMHTGLKPVSDYIYGCVFAPDSAIPVKGAPESFDWRDHNVVTSVKDQGSCGSCYAFSAVGNIEGQYAMKYRELVDLSPQQIIDCDYVSQGCLGGFMSLALQSVLETIGIETEADYPYKMAPLDDCYFERVKAKVTLATCYGYNLTSQEKLKQLVYKTGPISIAIQADGLHTYTGGILSDKQCNKGYVNHAVLLVGYGVEGNKPYWIIKNSWGDKWGEKGYFRVVRGENLNSCKMLNPDMCSAVVD